MIANDSRLRRAALWLPAKLYELGVRLRVAAYETAYRQPKRLDAMVISIGNLTLGGTGKTPMVDYVARYLKSEDRSVAVLTRGYGRASTGRRVLNAPPATSTSKASDTLNDSSSKPAYREFGDEPLMLARALPDVPIVIDKDRHAGGQWAIDKLGANVLVLDDGYQHLQLARDLNILLIDATDPFGGFKMVPFGRLREPLYGIKRADAVIITRADQPFDQAQTGAILRHFVGDKTPVMYVYSSLTRLRHIQSNEAYETNQFIGWKAALLCGIGNPQAFANDILQAGIHIVSESFFSDHHAFTQEELDRVTREAQDAGAEMIVTTEKDAVRLEGLRHGAIPLYAAQLEIQSEDDIRLKSLLLRTMVGSKK